MNLSRGFVLLVFCFVSGEICKSNDNCLNNKCLTTRRNDCLEGCKPGWFDEFCQQRCSPHCHCEEMTGNCTSCIPGWYGAECGSSCSLGCVDKICDRDGTCSGGCRKGFYGERCESTCPEQCYDDQCDTNGTCTTCRSGFYGAFCRQTCHRCIESVCDMITGECLKKCQSGFYGEDCAKTCRKCKDGACNQTTGACTKGCQPGNYGPDYTRKCKTCIDGVCDASTGECMTGCAIGYYGSFCNLTCELCEDGDCVQESGECRYKVSEENGEKWIALGGGMSVIIFTLTAVGMFYMFRRLKRMNVVVYDMVKIRTRPPTAVEDARPGYIELEEEVSINPPRVCPVCPARQTSYIEPQHSGGIGNNLQVQRQLQAVGVSDQQKDEPLEATVSPSDRLIQIVHRRHDECSFRPDSYVLPNYSEVNEELMAGLPQPAQGAQAPAPVIKNSSFSVVADVHTTEADINIPLIADCFGSIETEDSSPDEDNLPCAQNYDNLLRDSKTQISQATASGYSQFDDETKFIHPMLHPMSTAKPASYIEPQHSGSTVSTQQRLLSARVSDQQDEEPQGPAASPSDRLLQEVAMATLPQPGQRAEMSAAVANNSSSSDEAGEVNIEGGIRIPLIAECFGSTETKDSSPDEDSNQLVENYDHLFRDHYMEH